MIFTKVSASYSSLDTALSYHFSSCLHFLLQSTKFFGCVLLFDWFLKVSKQKELKRALASLSSSSVFLPFFVCDNWNYLWRFTRVPFASFVLITNSISDTIDPGRFLLRIVLNCFTNFCVIGIFAWIKRLKPYLWT